MTGLTALWLPILLSAVFVFILSSIIHMMLPWHKNDYAKLPNEEAFRASVRPLNIPPGDYIVPNADGMEEMKSPEFKKKFDEGPVVIMTVRPPGEWGMTGNLVQWFIYLLVVGVFSAYVTGRALGQSSPYLHVFRFVGVTAFCCHSLALFQMSIWWRRSWATTIRSTIDGLIYALVTAGTFGWLWPQWT